LLDKVQRIAQAAIEKALKQAHTPPPPERLHDAVEGVERAGEDNVGVICMVGMVWPRAFAVLLSEL
jgi:hypothetical protein